MDAYINKGKEGYFSFAPQMPHILSNLGPVASTTEINSLHYLNPEHQLKTIETITNYQKWAESGWKKPHGTYEAALRFIGKLFEEVDELQQADKIFMNNKDELKSPEYAHDLLSELGDVLWCTTALASNSSADIDSALKIRMYEYTMGLNFYDDGAKMTAPWRNDLAMLATSESNIKLSDISEVIAEGFEPQPSTAMNLEYDDSKLEIFQHMDMLKNLTFNLRSIVDQQYNYGETENLYIMPELYDDRAHIVASLAAEVYLNIAYIARERLDTPLEGVVAVNMAKINARIESQRVDKIDGNRSTNLL